MGRARGLKRWAREGGDVSRPRSSSVVPGLNAVAERLDLSWSAADEAHCLEAGVKPDAANRVSDPTYGETVDPLPLTDAAVGAAVELLAERCQLDAPLLLTRLTGGLVASEARRGRAGVTEVTDWQALLRVWSHLPYWRAEDFAGWWAARVDARLPATSHRAQRHSPTTGSAAGYVTVMFAATGD